MAFDITFFLFAIPAVIFAGVSKAGFGSGASFASASILALILTPGQALGVMLPLLMLIDAASLRPYWGKWDWSIARRLAIGAIPGIFIAVWIYQIANADIFRFMIGAMSLLFVLYQGAKSMSWVGARAKPFGPTAGFFTGAVGGFTSFVSHAGGPPIAIYLLSQKLPKTTYQATTVIVFWVINIMKFIPYALLGIFTWQTFLADLLLAPVALLGTWLGVRAHHLVSERVFFSLTYVLLVATGSKLIWDATDHLFS
ncbi:sulfite exporter TauE/SafE family protein [Parasulfitobacter algicola]|uniref:Probable membrane transporter protein n=1 Tax=Parasulfitobacter algicola TaxID=2614809 RepID=A0ABX2IRB6_9RHOB|nr:sulfite exporter TauE/SafE family protein [Sulfitobacter algicola]NSX55065.1 sulfite exporter TauE/SafE family protein [Sulfitobacter algicola]